MVIRYGNHEKNCIPAFISKVISDKIENTFQGNLYE